LSEDLLYISNVSTVTVYSYPRGRHVGTLKGFYRPEGECSDAAGDIFIADGNNVLEYAHGGTKSIGSFSLSGYAAVSCAVDPTTGNLAISWDAGFSNGYVAVYQNAMGNNPSLYNNGSMLFAWCGYDNSGNLFVDGQIEGSGFRFAELPKGSSTMKNITLDQSIEFEGPVQWDGKYMAVGDNELYRIYRFAISGSNGTLEGTVNLGSAQGVYQWWIQGKRVVGSDDSANTAWIWDYPAGGSPIKSITKAVFHPFGATISKAPR
jgi:hypothetical protein